MKPRWDETKNAAENARAALPRMARRWFRGGMKAARARSKPAELHRFRLDTKAFRYTLEIFLPLYGPTLEKLLESVRGIQQILGQLNDSETVLQMGIDDASFAGWLRRRMRERRRRFLESWSEGLASEQVHRRWIAYLGRRRTSGRTPSKGC